MFKFYVEVLLATANAPVYFDTPAKIEAGSLFDGSYVDGGIGGNCPLKQVRSG